MLERGHRGLRHLHLNLVADPGLGIAPIVRGNEAARSGRRTHGGSDIMRRRAKLAGKYPVDVHVHRRIAKWLLKFHIAQFLNLREFLSNAIGIAQHVGILWTGDGHFGRRRRTEVERLTDEISWIEREMATWKLLR